MAINYRTTDGKDAADHLKEVGEKYGVPGLVAAIGTIMLYMLIAIRDEIKELKK